MKINEPGKTPSNHRPIESREPKELQALSNKVTGTADGILFHRDVVCAHPLDTNRFSIEHGSDLSNLIQKINE